jgi:chromosome segregation ATPase
MGYVKTDGSVYARQVLGQSEFTKIEKLKLFASLDTLEEDWSAVKKLETAHIESIKRQINMANYELGEARKKHEAAKSELKTAEQTLSSLGILKIKEKMQLKEKIESLKYTIRETGYDISDIEEKRKRIQSAPKRWRYIDLKAQHDEAMHQVRSMMNQSAVTSTPKNSSVLKSAAVGAIVAGPAGAVVGAIYAADKNRKNNSK